MMNGVFSRLIPIITLLEREGEAERKGKEHFEEEGKRGHWVAVSKHRMRHNFRDMVAAEERLRNM